MVPQKASGGRGGRGGGRIPHFNWSIYRGGNFFFFFFFLEPGLKLDEKSIENGLEGQKCSVGVFSGGGCHHPKKSHQSSNNIHFFSDSCNKLPEIYNLQTSTTLPVYHSDQIHVFCDTGYSLQGDSVIECVKGSVYRYSNQVPYCKLGTAVKEYFYLFVYSLI